jgi:hypothetical protein
MIPELRPCTDDELPPGFTGGFHSRMPLMDMPPLPRLPGAAARRSRR